MISRILPIVFVLTPFLMTAQDFVYQPSQHRVDTVTNPNYANFEIDIETPSPEGITYAWEMISNTLDSNWAYSLCDYNGCFVGIPATGLMTNITLADAQNGVHGFFILNITVGQYYGSGKAEIYVYDTEDYTRGDTVSFEVFWGGISGIDSPEEAVIKIYPNPTADNVSIANSSSEGINYSLINVVGETLVTDRLIPGSVQQIDMSQYSSGVYILSYFSKEGVQMFERIVKE